MPSLTDIPVLQWRRSGLLLRTECRKTGFGRSFHNHCCSGTASQATTQGRHQHPNASFDNVGFEMATDCIQFKFTYVFANQDRNPYIILTLLVRTQPPPTSVRVTLPSIRVTGLPMVSRTSSMLLNDDITVFNVYLIHHLILIFSCL